MPEPQKPVSPKPAARPVAKAEPLPEPAAPERDRRACKKEDAVICERCGAEMFRMHAVWRCPNCRFKTDCCGW